MNIVLFHLHKKGAVVILRYGLLRTSEQQLDSEVILKLKRSHISWKKELSNFKNCNYGVFCFHRYVCLSSYIMSPLMLYLSHLSRPFLNTTYPHCASLFFRSYVCT
jgi:hypothetical protein